MADHGELLYIGMKRQCQCVARFFQIEELANSAIFEEDRIIVALEGEATLTLRKESRQLLKVVRVAAAYLLFLAVLYFI